MLKLLRKGNGKDKQTDAPRIPVFNIGPSAVTKTSLKVRRKDFKMRATRHKSPVIVVDNTLIKKEVKQYGIAESLEVIDALGSIVGWVIEFLRHGLWSPWRLPQRLWRLGETAWRLVQAIRGCNRIPKEIMNLNKRERDQLWNRFMKTVLEQIGWTAPKKK